MAYTQRSSPGSSNIPSYQNFHRQTNAEPEKTLLAESPAIPSVVQKDQAAPTTALTESETKLKKTRLPKAIRKKKRNRVLSRIVTPKSALMLLNELKPGVMFNVSWPLGSGPMYAEAVHEGQVIGQGQGNSKSAAKNAAAECAFKKIIKSIMTDHPTMKMTPEDDADDASKTAMDEGDNDVVPLENKEGEEETACDKLPWAGLASFALYRLFRQWHNEGVPLPLSGKISNLGLPGAPVNHVIVPNPVTKLPENASTMHPVSLLNQMHPGIKMEELSRQPGPQSSVTVGYRINDRLYTGVASNRKTARKIAAANVCLALYGLNLS